jgi:eukaryotic-like serine/threonine-protein kinase
MAATRNTVCPACSGALRADEPACPRCLLGRAASEFSEMPAERLFKEALSKMPSERAAFLKEAAPSMEVLAEAEMLLQGYEESGGDAERSAPKTAPPEEAPDNGETAAADEAPGAVIDHFTLVRRLGEGGMGSVWLAEQTEPVRRSVALKVIKLGMDTREVVRRFRRERQTLAFLNHPNIARVFEAGATSQGRPYFVMELVEGRPITSFCEAEGLDLAARLSLFREVCAAVEHAHQKGVIHRDLKPSNILVANGAVKIIDFGVAKATQRTDETPLFTLQSQILGTPAYMSPEQARTSGLDVDTRTDVYSLGVILYELLTGVTPIDPKRLSLAGAAEMQRILLEEDPPTPSTRLKVVGSGGAASASGCRLKLRNDLDWVVMKAIRKDRDERYSSAAALSEDLRRHLDGEPVLAVPPTAAYRLGKFVRRHRLAVVAAATVLLALTAGIVVSLMQMRRAQTALAGEAKARGETTFTLSDMHARLGLAASDAGDPTRAALWFANAAILGAKDSERLAANRMRTAAWRQEAMTAVRAFDTGFDHLHELKWNPRHPAMIIDPDGQSVAQIWDLDREQLWAGAIELKAVRAAWSAAGDCVALTLTDGSLRVLSYPDGRELARRTDVLPIPLAWSPDDRWIAVGGVLWDWRDGEVRKLPVLPGQAAFSRDGRYALLQWEELEAVCAVENPAEFLHTPVPAQGWNPPLFLGDGDRFVVGVPTGGLKVYDTATGTVLESHTGGMTGKENGWPIDATRDGRFIARRNEPVIDLERPDQAAFPRHQGLFKAARFSPDGSLLASGGYDNRAELWSVRDGTYLGEVGRHHVAVINLEFSPDGRFVASAEDGLVRVWRIGRRELVRRLPLRGWEGAHAGTVGCLAAVSADGRLVAGSGFNNRGGEIEKTLVREIGSGRAAGPEIAPGGRIMDAQFSADGALLALAVSTSPDRSDGYFTTNGGSGNLQLWDYRAGRRLGDEIPMPSEPRGLRFHPSGRWIGACCAGGEGVEVELAGRVNRELFNTHAPVNAGATLNNGRCGYSADGRIFAAWGLYEYIHLFDREAGRELMETHEPSADTHDLAFGGRVAARAVVASKMRIEFRDAYTGAEAAPSIPFVNWPFLTRFSADGNLLLTAGGGHSAQLWDWRKGTLVCPMLPHDETVMGGGFVPGAPWVVTGGHDGKVKFWDRHTGMQMRPPVELGGWVLEVQVTPDGRTVVASGFLGGNIDLIDLADAMPPPELDAEGARLLAEIDADAEVHPGGGLAALTPQAWIGKWREFRNRYPRFAGHSLTPKAE